MRWLILALSLGTTLATLWRGIMLFITNLGIARAASSPFWWTVTLCIGSLFGFIGGVLAFNHKLLSLIFLFTATVMTYLGYSQSHILAYSFGSITIITFIYLIMFKRSKYKERYGYSEDEYYDEYDDEEYEDEDGDEDDEDAEDDGEEKSAAKVKYTKIPKRRSSYSMPQGTDALTIKSSPQRQRETKVCLTCGIDVPISYKFCPLCGTELYAHPDSKVDVSSKDKPDDTPQNEFNNAEVGGFKDVKEDMKEEIIEEKKEETIRIVGMETEAETRDVKRRYRYKAIKEDENMNENDDNEETEINKNFINDKPEEVEVVPVVRKTSPNRINDEESQKSDDAPFKPLSTQSKKQRSLEVDSSYQSFGRYTQSRKRRKVSVFQRALLFLLTVCFIGGVGTFIYKGIKRVEPQNKTDDVTQIININDIPDDIDTPPDIFDENFESINLVVSGETENQPTVWRLPNMSVVPAQQIVTIGDGVNLRENHTTVSRSIQRLPVNNTYTLLEQWKTDDVSSLAATDRNLTGVWYKIQVNDREGWIYGQYALPFDGRAASLPAGYTDALLNSFGSSGEEIEATLGKPVNQQTRGDTIVLDYTSLSITLRQNIVQGIQITGRGHNLPNGLSVGITFEEVYRIIGAPNKYRDGVLSYMETPNRGIVIRRENDGRVRSINIGAA
ncbi:MAG: SH3 domain-containing protein [Synergistaceae bacterium]|nr:SH3 domain-containing protein [Synergistaceae bacterium]